MPSPPPPGLSRSVLTLRPLRNTRQEHASDIDRNVRPELKLDWREIKFLLLLGSGTFGDCYKGSIGGRDVAVSESEMEEEDKSDAS